MRFSRAVSSALSYLAMTTAATLFPTRLVSARASDMNRSTPMMRAMLATGIWPQLRDLQRLGPGSRQVAAQRLAALFDVLALSPFTVQSNNQCQVNSNVESGFGKLRDDREDDDDSGA
jgi:hypothetical protein